MSEGRRKEALFNKPFSFFQVDSYFSHAVLVIYVIKSAAVRHQQAGGTNQLLDGLSDTTNLRVGFAYRDPANNVCANQSNPTGAVIVNFGTLDFTPGNNFGYIGYIRFRVRVD